MEQNAVAGSSISASVPKVIDIISDSEAEAELEYIGSQNNNDSEWQPHPDEWETGSWIIEGGASPLHARVSPSPPANPAVLSSPVTVDHSLPKIWTTSRSFKLSNGQSKS
jgi:hypothetical protein